MRQPMVAGNWKMYGSRASVAQLLNAIKQGSAQIQGVELVVFPPYLFIEQASVALANSQIAWGAQNVSAQVEGAFTGEISPNMLVDFGCRYVLVGHSERRTLYGETNIIVAEKFAAALAAGLKPVLCVGETLAEREASKTEQVIQQQLAAVLSLKGGVDLFSKAVIAYEPVWAIGTGQTAKPEQAQAVHQFIRRQIAELDKNVAQRLRILYGGSVKRANAKELFLMPDIDGGLIGGASLDANEFLDIARSCNN